MLSERTKSRNPRWHWIAVGLILAASGYAIYDWGVRVPLTDGAPEAMKPAEASRSGAGHAGPPEKVSPADPASPASPLAAKKLKTLEQILSSRNDNDPRLDSELRALDPATRAVFRTRYLHYPKESRNERGTIVFLLGRNLEDATDLAFLRQVMAEPPCLSLGDCTRETAPATGETAHLQSTTGVTLAYPQLMALRSVRQYLRQTGPVPLPSARREEIETVIQAGLRSPIPALNLQAAALQTLLQNTSS